MLICIGAGAYHALVALDVDAALILRCRKILIVTSNITVAETILALFCITSGGCAGTTESCLGKISGLVWPIFAQLSPLGSVGSVRLGSARLRSAIGPLERRTNCINDCRNCCLLEWGQGF